VTLRRDGTITQANLLAATQLGRERSRLHDVNFARFVAVDEYAGSLDWLNRSFSSDTGETRLVKIERDDQATVIAQLSATVSIDQEECRIAFMNVTEEYELEEERRAAQEQISIDELRKLDLLKDQFIALASHEIRTPLTSILGFSSTMIQRWAEISDEDKEAYVKIINDQAERMGQLIDDVLILSRINSGVLRVQRESVIIADVIDQVVQAFGDDKFEVSCPRALRAFVDPRHLNQAIVNYVSNAFKYGAPPVEIYAAHHGEWIEIQVSDHGPGVNEEFRPHLFEEFSRADGGVASGQPGTGLGLSIVRRLMNAQGAEVAYEPNVPNGARFILRLPTPDG
jgi:signal transduction histidine kinase